MAAIQSPFCRILLLWARASPPTIREIGGPFRALDLDQLEAFFAATLTPVRYSIGDHGVGTSGNCPVKVVSE